MSGQTLTSPALEDSPSGTSQQVYDYGLGLAAISDAAGSTSYLDADLTGNVVGLSGPNGQRSASYFYLPFGQETQTSKTESGLLQLAGLFGVTSTSNGLVDMRSRFYNPSTGRYFSPDPAGLNGGSNLYNYSINDPVDFTDPTGLKGISVFHLFSQIFNPHVETAVPDDPNNPESATAQLNSLGDQQGVIGLNNASKLEQNEFNNLTAIVDIGNDTRELKDGTKDGIDSKNNSDRVKQAKGTVKTAKELGEHLGNLNAGLSPSYEFLNDEFGDSLVGRIIKWARSFFDPHYLTFDGLRYDSKLPGNSFLRSS